MKRLMGPRCYYYYYYNYYYYNYYNNYYYKIFYYYYNYYNYLYHCYYFTNRMRAPVPSSSPSSTHHLKTAVEIGKDLCVDCRHSLAVQSSWLQALFSAVMCLNHHTSCSKAACNEVQICLLRLVEDSLSAARTSPAPTLWEGSVSLDNSMIATTPAKLPTGLQQFIKQTLVGLSEASHTSKSPRPSFKMCTKHFAHTKTSVVIVFEKDT
jgi:hypothetical protein